MDEFVTQFIDAGTKRFGSGWVWLVLENNKMKWKTTANADNPIGDDVEVLAGCDVWEHSYYLDYKNDRKKYLETWIKNLINFEFIQSRLFEL